MTTKKKIFPKIGTPLFAFESVDSTNNIAKKLAEYDFAEGTSVIADFQTKGKGRFGRNWLSPSGENIYLSVILRPKDINDVQFLSILGAAAIAKTIKAFYRGKIEIKWPNDVFVDGKKISGVLSELKTTGSSLRYVVMGFGINLNSNLENFNRNLKNSSISLSMAAKRNIEKDSFLRKFFINLEDVYKKHRRGAKARILNFVNSILYKKGSIVLFDIGKKKIRGKVKGINENGSIKLICGQKCLNLASGEILK